MEYKEDKYINGDILSIAKDSHYGNGEDAYNFKLVLFSGAKNLISLIHHVSSFAESVEYGASLVITDKQLILTFNGDMGAGSHNAALARIYADMTDQGKLGYYDTIKCRKILESNFINARIYVEKYTPTESPTKIVAFSFDREGRRITPREFQGFMMFYDEYAELLKRENFDVSLMGKQMSIDEVKEVLEALIDPNLDVSNILHCEERIIGTKIGEQEEKKQER